MALTLTEEFDPTTNLPRDIYVANPAYQLKNNSTGKLITTRVRATPDGNYQVYSTNRTYNTILGIGVPQADQLVYSYNAANNTYTFNNGDGYKLSDYAGSQLDNINKNIKKDLYTTIPRNAANAISNLPGYQSISNSNQPRTPVVDPNAAQALQQGTGVIQDPPPAVPTAEDPAAPTSQLQPLLTDEEFAGQFSKTVDIKYKSVLRYPINQSKDETYDYLKIDVLKYVKSNLVVSGTNTIDLARPSERLKDILGTVILPMQPNISDSNGVSWNEDQLNVIQGAFASAAYSSVDSAGNIGSGGDFVNWLKTNAANLGSTLGTIANDPGLSTLISGYFAGQAVGANVIGRATGAVINNNLELLFAGPKLRTFRYSYRFTPREKDEAEMIRKIIRLFKREMATSRSDTGLFLQTPNVFQLKYIYNGDESGTKGTEHPYLNKIKPCALTNFSVNYTPDGTYMTYAEGGSMTSYTIDMEFSELEPIYKEDYPTSEENIPNMGY